MSLVETSIRRPVFAWMLMIGLIAFGYLSFREMGVSQLPDVDFPVVNISITLAGAAPEVMERDVVDPIEGAVVSIEGVHDVSSTARDGVASITLEFDLGKNIDVAVQEVQTKIAQAQKQLPTGIDPPIVTKSNPEDQPIIWMAVSSDRMALPDLMAFVRDEIRDRFTTLPGVADVFLGGYVDPAMRVWVSKEKLNQYQLSVSDVVRAVGAEHSELPAGRLEIGTKELNIRSMGEASTVEEFSKLSINSRGGAPIFSPIALSQVAKVELGLADIRRKSRVMGNPAVGLGLRKQRGSNAVDVARGALKRLAEVKKTLPAGMDLGINFDSTKFIEEAVGELEFTLILAALLTALVCWAFLGSWSATVNVILAIPTSIVGTFIVLHFLGFTLNSFTLLGLSLSIGIVVDDAIMVLENIVRRREEGKDKLRAAYLGAREITFAAMAATIAVVAIFLPVAFMKGLIGRYFFQFGVTITVAVGLSLLEALTLTPMRCAQFLNVGHRTTAFGRGIERAFERMAESYAAVLPKLIRVRWWVIVGSLVLFFGSLAATKFIKKEFVPSQDEGTLFIRLKAPDGSRLEYTDTKMKDLEKIVSQTPEVERYFASTGGFGGGGAVNSGIVFVTLKDRKLRKRSQQQVSDDMRAKFKDVPDVKIFIQDLSQSGFGGGRGFPIEFSIQGPELDTLAELEQKMMKQLKESKMMADIDSDYQPNTQEVHIVPDRDLARARGVSIAEISQTVSSMMGGTTAGKYTRKGRRFDIIVQLSDVDRTQLSVLDQLNVRNNRGEVISLREVVKVVEKPGFQSINRENRRRSITVFGNPATGVSQEKILEKIHEIAKSFPDGYVLSDGGNSETFKESFTSLIFALVLGLFVSYMVLASQFNSFIDPITVLVALPFSISGAFVGLLLGHQSLNIYSMIGIILLMGIVKKNSILLVDFTNQTRDNGMNLFDSIVHACPMRLRPILMTSFATIAGAVPAALALGPGAEARIPMAIAVIGGSIFSTILTLFVVPCVYYVFARERERPVDLSAILVEEKAEIERLFAQKAVSNPAHTPVLN